MVSQMSFLNDTTLMLSSQRNNNVLVDLKTNAIANDDEEQRSDFEFTIYPNAEFKVRVPFNSDSIMVALKRKWLSVAIRMNNKKFTYKLPYDRPYFPSWRCFVQRDKRNKTWVGIDNTILEIDPDGTEKLHQMQNTILSMFIDKQDGLWVGLLNNGIHYFPGSRMEEDITSLPELSVSGICEDNEDGVWCTTLEKGIFYCRNRSVIDHSNSEDYKKPVLLKFIDGHLFTSGHKNVLVDMYHGQTTRHVINVSNLPFADIARYGDKDWLLCSNNFLGVVDHKYSLSTQLFVKVNIAAASKQVTDQVNGVQYGLMYGAVYRVENAKVTWMKKTPMPARCLLLNRLGKLYIGGSDGIHVLKDTSWINIPGVNAYISKMVQLSNGQIWITTKDGGIFIL
jgi:ligand-binding sensor domain-containing protein